MVTMFQRSVVAAALLVATMAANRGPAKITATDDRPRTITLSASPKRIVSLAPATTEYLYAAGLGDRVVGISDYCKFPPSVEGKRRVGSLTNPSLETIVALKPDLVVAAKLNPLEALDRIEALKIPVFGTDPKTLNAVLGCIARLARIGGTEKLAAEQLKPIRDRLARVKRQMAGLNPDHRPRVFYLLETDPIFTAGKGSIVDECIGLAGGLNLAADLPKPWGNFSMETLVARDPEVLIVVGDDPVAAVRRVTEQEPKFQLLTAVKKNRIIAFTSDFLGNPTPRAVEGMEKLAKFLHPQIFAAKPKEGQ